MPHLDLRFNSEIVSGDVLFESAAELLMIVAKHFNEKPDYVSLEVTPQTKWTLNRKSVDIELNSSPDPEGLRSAAANALAAELADGMIRFLAKRGVNCEVSAWVRVYDTGLYEYRSSLLNA